MIFDSMSASDLNPVRILTTALVSGVAYGFTLWALNHARKIPKEDRLRNGLVALVGGTTWSAVGDVACLFVPKGGRSVVAAALSTAAILLVHLLDNARLHFLSRYHGQVPSSPDLEAGQTAIEIAEDAPLLAHQASLPPGDAVDKRVGVFFDPLWLCDIVKRALIES